MLGALRLLVSGVVLVLLMAAPAWADPPDRVGRISVISGDVVFRETHRADDEDATLNWPVTSGNVIATGRMARAEIRVGATALRLDEDTELEVVQLDDGNLRLRLLEGTLAVRVKNNERAAEFDLETAQGHVRLLAPGRYRFDTDRGGDDLEVTAFEGRAVFEGRDTTATIRAGQRAEVVGDDEQRLEIGRADRDDFDEWTEARDRRDESARSLRFVSHEMTGYEDLDDHGDWRETPEYGAVWYPRAIAADWAPYRWGRWAWVEPWGWTWIDDAPWGFAPFHYGRWALVGGTWGWVPGRVVARPVYAPALVAWVGKPGWSANFHLGSVSAVGWFPLAPREIYRPGHRCTTDYVRRVNDHPRGAALPPEPPRREGGPPQYVFQRVAKAITVAPAAAVAAGRPLRREVAPVRDLGAIMALPVAASAPAVTPVRRPPRPEGKPPERRFGERTAPRPLAERTQERRTPEPPRGSAEPARALPGRDVSRPPSPPEAKEQPRREPPRDDFRERLERRAPALLVPAAPRASPQGPGDQRPETRERAQPRPSPDFRRPEPPAAPTGPPQPVPPIKAPSAQRPGDGNAARERRAAEIRERMELRSPAPEQRAPRPFFDRERRQAEPPAAQRAPAPPQSAAPAVQRPPERAPRPMPQARQREERPGPPADAPKTMVPMRRAEPPRPQEGQAAAGRAQQGSAAERLRERRRSSETQPQHQPAAGPARGMN